MNAFEIYAVQSSQYLQIKQHTESSQSLILNLISKEKAERHDLDLLHKILKHTRSCQKQCPARQLAAEMRSFVLSQLNDPSLPLIVCLIDLIKSNAMDNLDELIDWACQLWHHPSISVVRKAMELCKRAQDRLQTAHASLVTHTIRYITHCQSSFSSQDIVRFQSSEYTEFFYTPSTCDRESTKLLVQILLSLLFKMSDSDLLQLTQKAQEVYELNPTEFLPLLFDLCCASDDDAIALLNSVLLLFQERQETHVFFDSLHLNPHTLLVYFIYRSGNSHDILIDLLLEPDSDFLSYFYRYILYALKDIDSLLSSLIEDQDLQSILAHTLRVLQGSGFPYNTKPLVKRLTQLEDLLY